MFARPLAAIGFHSATVVDSHVVIVDTDVIGLSTTPYAGQAVHLEQTTLTGCTISVVFNSVSHSGGLLLISESTLSHSNVDVSVTTNISVPAAFPTAVLIINSSIIMNGSNVALYLPQEVGVTSPSGLVTLAALYFHNVVVEASFLEVLSRGSPYAPSASRLTWSSSCVSAVGIEVINSSSFVLGGESIAFQSLTITGMPTIVISQVNITDSIAVLSAHADSNIQIVNCQFLATSTAAAANRLLEPLLVISLPTVLALLGGTIEVNISKTYVEAPWITPTSSARWPFILFNTTNDQAALNLSIIADELFVYGITSLVTLPASVSSAPSRQIVGSVELHCAWWGRHRATVTLSPLHVALKGSVLRDGTTACSDALGNSTVITATSASVLFTDNSTLQCPVWEEGVPAMRSSTLSAIIPATTTTSATVTPHHIRRGRTATSSSTIVSATRGATSSSYTYSSQNALTTRFIVTSSVSATSQPSISTSHSPQASISFGSSQQSRTPTITPAFSHRPQQKPTRSLTTNVNASHRDLQHSVTFSTSLAPTSTHAATMTKPLPHSLTHLSSMSQSADIIFNAATLDAPPAIQAAAYASMAGAVVGGGTVGEAATIATLAMMTCAGKRTWDSNTGAQRLVVSVFYDLGPGASIVGNVGITLAVYALQRGYVLFATTRAQRSTMGHGSIKRHAQIVGVDAVAALVRYPSLSWALLMFLFPGILFSAVSLFSTPSDDLIGASVAGRAAFGSITLVGAVSVVAGIVYHAIKRVFPAVHPASTADVLCEPHLPRWFLRIAGSWLLPRVMWEPNELKLQYGEFFSSVASIDAMQVAPLLQVHGAVFSLIAAIPFPQSACAAQFVLAIVWMCVPVVLLLKWELKLLRRPPSNPLVLLSNLVVIGVLIATLVFVEGPPSAQSAAASARDALGDVLTAVSILNTCFTAVGTAAEMIARRSSDVVAETGKLEFIRGDREAEWDHNVLREPQQHFAKLQTDALELLIDGMLDGVEEVVTEASRDDKGRQKEIYNQKSAVVHKLDDCIERITNDPLFVAARNQRGNQRDLSQNNDRVLRFTLKLLVTRAARGGGSRPSRK